MGWSLKRAVFGPPKPPRAKSPEELFPGVPLPSMLLVGMAVSQMQQEYELLTKIRSRLGYVGYTYKWEKGPVKISWDYEEDSNRSNKWLDGPELRVDGGSFQLKPREIERLKAACKAAMKWKIEFDLNKAEMDRQQKATDLIATFFEKKPEPVPVPVVEDKKDSPFLDAVAAVEPSANVNRAGKRSVAKTAKKGLSYKIKPNHEFDDDYFETV
jgi:hypothetical protein